MKGTSTEIEHALQKRDIESLTKEMREGFEGVHKRQDIANGRTRKLEEWENRSKGAFAIISMILVPILIYIITNRL